MIGEVWFDSNVVGAWVGSILGVAGGVEGTLAGFLAPRGKAKRLVLGMHGIMLAACTGLAILGGVAYFQDQPYPVWYGLGYPGVLGLAIFGALTPVLRKRYREAELRISMARDLSVDGLKGE